MASSTQELETEKTREFHFKQRLLEPGLLTEIKPPVPPDALPKDRRAIEVEGNAVSDLVIRERR